VRCDSQARAGAGGGGYRLTIARIAQHERLSETSVRRLLTRARRELFGEISDSAIYKRLDRNLDRELRFCEEDGCEEELPARAHGNQHYCARHRTGAARARRHRRSFEAADKGAPRREAVRQRQAFDLETGV
jgi:hypothetical protein